MYYFSKVAFTLATQNCELIIQLVGTEHLCASHWLFCISPPFMPMSYKMLRSIWSNWNISHSPSVFYSHFLNSIAFQGRFDRSFNKSNFSNQGKYIIKLDKQSQMKSLALLESNSDSQVLALLDFQSRGISARVSYNFLFVLIDADLIKSGYQLLSICKGT